MSTGSEIGAAEFIRQAGNPFAIPTSGKRIEILLFKTVNNYVDRPALSSELENVENLRARYSLSSYPRGREVSLRLSIESGVAIGYIFIFYIFMTMNEAMEIDKSVCQAIGLTLTLKRMRWCTGRMHKQHALIQIIKTD